MKEVEFEITPTGKIRTHYEDTKQELLNKLNPNWQVQRASDVEWEQGEMSGWTVRAHHDHELAIRITLKDGMYKRGVSRTGDILYFTTRQAALEAELEHFWELLPPKEITP